MTTGEAVSRLNPWFGMWTRPRETMREIVTENPERFSWVLAAVAGIASMLNQASAEHYGDTAPLSLILVLAAVTGSVGGVVGMKFGALLIEMTGFWMGGRANRTEICAALAWGSVPAIWSLAVWAAMILVAGHDMFTTDRPYLTANPNVAILLLPLLILWVIMTIWRAVVTFLALKQVQGFSTWRTFVNCLLALFSSAILLIPLRWAAALWA